jgi:hypothetical protein
MILDELVGQGVEQRLVRGGVGGAEVVDGLDEADGEEASPEPIHDGPRERAVAGRGHPGGEHGAGVLAVFQLDARPIQRSGAEELAGPGLGDADLPRVGRCPLATAATGRHADVDGGSLVVGLAVELHAAEEGGHAVIVVLRVAFERVVVALRALDPDAEEGVGRRLGEVLGPAVDEVIAAGRLLAERPPGRQHVADDLVPGPIRAHLLAEPVRERADPFPAAPVAVALQAVLHQLAPGRRPRIDVCLALQEPIDQGRALRGARVGLEGEDGVGVGERAGQVEGDAAEERPVVAARRRRQPHRAQHLHDVVVDPVRPLREQGRIDLLVVRRRDDVDGDLPLEAGHDRRGTGAEGRHLAVLVDAGEALLVRLEQGEPGHVAAQPAAVDREDLEGARPLRPIRGRRRLDDDRRDLRLGLRRARRPGGDPGQERLVFRRADREPVPPLVRHDQQRLGQE